LFQYACLLVLERFLDHLNSQKALICLYILWYNLAALYLARSLGAAWPLAMLLALPFSVNSAVYAGFVNFALGFATCMFLIGFWIRYHGRLTLRRSAVLLAGIFVTATMHPIPLVLFLLFVGVHSAVTGARTLWQTEGAAAMRLKAAWSSVAGAILP